MKLYTNNYYSEDINGICRTALPWNKLRGKSVMLSGATGLIGSVFVDAISEKNKKPRCVSANLPMIRI